MNPNSDISIYNLSYNQEKMQLLNAKGNKYNKLQIWNLFFTGLKVKWLFFYSPELPGNRKLPIAAAGKLFMS